MIMNDHRKWRLVLARDLNADKTFVYAVRSTGIYCRPSCPSKRPQRDRVEFFPDTGAAEKAGYRPCRRCRPNDATASGHLGYVRSAMEFINRHADERLTLAQISRHVGLSPFHLQRIFTRLTGITPRQFQQSTRLRLFKSRLAAGSRITDAVYEAGYGSSSRLYETASAELGMTPSSYRKQAAGVRIDFTVLPSDLGLLLIAATARGICRVAFGKSAKELYEILRAEFPLATIERDDTGLKTFSLKLAEFLKGQPHALDLPLDLQATVFERKVWNAIRSIPYGATRSYSQVAAQVGNPRAVRAVARACAANPVALAVPCHRVIGRNGALAGYRWGIERKAALLKMERERKS